MMMMMSRKEGYMPSVLKRLKVQLQYNQIPIRNRRKPPETVELQLETVGTQSQYANTEEKPDRDRRVPDRNRRNRQKP